MSVTQLPVRNEHSSSDERKTTIKESQFRQFLATRAAIEDEAKAVFKMYAEIKGYHQPDGWEIAEIGDDQILFSQFFCGEDDYRSLPLKYLLVDNPIELMRADHEAWLRGQEAKAAAKEAEKRMKQEETERETWKRLFLKYGTPDVF